MPPLLWCFRHPERSTSLKIFILTPKHNNTKKKKSKLNVFLISSKFCSSLHPSTLASVVLFEYSGCDGKQLFDLREACTLKWCIFKGHSPVLNRYIVVHCYSSWCAIVYGDICLLFFIVVNVALLLCCCTFDALKFSWFSGEKCSLYWNVQALHN